MVMQSDIENHLHRFQEKEEKTIDAIHDSVKKMKLFQNTRG